MTGKMQNSFGWKILVLACIVATIKCNPNRYYATMTAYEDAVNLWNENTTFRDPGCTPELFMLYARHGARNPALNYINRFRNMLLPLRDAVINNIKMGKSKLDGNTLVNWTVPYKDEEEYEQVEQGDIEMFGIGQRYKERFPELLNSNFDSRFHDVKHTTKNRTRDSARSLARGVFGERYETQADDDSLRFYQSCKKWKQTIRDTKVGKVESDRFRQSKVFKHMIKDVSERLGFLEKSELLTEAQVLAMFQSCRYDHVTQIDRNAPWCAAFSSYDLEIIEYHDDMKFYWTDSYGYKLNYVHACPPLKEIVNHISHTVAGINEKKALFRVSHQDFLQKLFAKLGVFEDERPQTASWWSSNAPVPSCNKSSESIASSNSESQRSSSESTEEKEFNVDDRKLRISKVGPLGGHIALVLYKCPEYKIKAFVQENEIKLPKCSESPCSLKEFLDAYSSIAETCDEDKEKACKV